MTDGWKITGTVLPGPLLSSEIHIWGLESLMAVTSLYIDMAENAPFLSAVRAVCLPGGSRGKTFSFTLYLLVAACILWLMVTLVHLHSQQWRDNSSSH